MKSNELVTRYIGARRIHDDAVGDMLAGVWSKLLQRVAALGGSVRLDSKPQGGLLQR